MQDHLAKENKDAPQADSFSASLASLGQSENTPVSSLPVQPEEKSWMQYWIHSDFVLDASSLLDLKLLYQPLTGSAAMNLFEFLCAASLRRQVISLEEIEQIQNSGFRMEPSLKILEQYRLVRTFLNAASETHLILQPPLSYEEFLAHPLYGKALFLALGSSAMEGLKEWYVPMLQEDWKEISAPFDASLLEDSWDDDRQDMLDSMLPRESGTYRYGVNWNLFYRKLGERHTRRLKNPRNEQMIAQMMASFGIGEIEMAGRVRRASNAEKTRIDFEQLRNSLVLAKDDNELRKQDLDGKPVLKTEKEIYSQSPMTFVLSRIPDNAELLPDERILIDDLCRRHQLSNEVMNTILEYAMEQSKGALVPKYLRILTNNVAKARITTREEARQYLNSSYSGKKNTQSVQLPDWYSDVKPEDDPQRDAQTIQELNDLMAELFPQSDADGDGQDGQEDPAQGSAPF